MTIGSDQLDEWGRRCGLPDCDSPHYGRGLCARHWARMTRNGSPKGGASDIYATPEAAFDARTEHKGECLVWTGSTDPMGYGRIRTGRRYVLAHRWAYEKRHGPIGEGLVIDHECWTPGCVNADHLRAISQAENTAYRSGANKNSKTGVRNVYAVDGVYEVYVSKGGKKHHAGRFPDVDSARQAATELRNRVFGAYAGKG